MTNRRGAACLLFLAFVSALQGAHEPGPGVVSFVRSSVEKIPEEEPTYNAKHAYSERLTFGETFLPLRSAVESAPAFTLDESQSFVRSSVEFRPVGESSDLSEPIVSASNVRVAYTSYDTDHPYPFRSGSPYQQIVDLDSVGLNVNNLRGRLSQENQQHQVQRVTELRESEKDYRVLCHITSWSFHRQKDGKFAPENLDTSLCTHVVYSFASLNANTLTIKEFDPWADIDNALYKRVTSLNIPVLLAIGGWTDSTGNKYSRLVASPIARRNFVSSTVAFVQKYGFQGLHFDWNYPVCWQSNCKNGPENDKPNFTKLIRELAEEFDKHSLLLGVALSGYKEVITKAYDVRELSDAATFLTVMSYDYHGAWEEYTGHVSPLYGRPNDKYPQYNTDYTIQLLVKEGADKEKLIIGVPFYGQTFQLKEERRLRQRNIGEGTPSIGPGNPGEFTRQPGMLAYYEICSNIRKHKWETGRDATGKSGPYAWSRDQWVGYEDVQSIIAKADYVANNGYGGVAAWTIDLDDFLNKCCFEPYPLLRAINRRLGRLSTSQPNIGSCARPPAPVTPIAPVMTTVGENGIPGEGYHEHTTWPSWNPSQLSSSPKPAIDNADSEQTTKGPVTWWPTKSTTTTARPTKPAYTRPPTTSRPSVVPGSVNVEPVILPGQKCKPGEYHSHPSKCDAYYRCVYSHLSLNYCAGGLHWNQAGILCDWPETAKCPYGQNDEVDEDISEEIEEEPLPSSTTTTTTKRPRPSRTSRRTTTKAVTTTTTPTTTTTTTPRPTTRAPTTTHRPSRRPHPSRTSTTTAKPHVEHRPLADSTSCVNGEYYPDPDDCGSFFICVNNKMISQECGPGLQWSQKDKACDRAKKVRCVSAVRYLRLISMQNPYLRKSQLQLDDPCNGDTHVPYPGRCGGYLRCLFGHLFASDCPPELHWNNQYKVCDWPNNAHCDEEEGVSLPDLEPSDDESFEDEEYEDLDSEIIDSNDLDEPTKRPAAATSTTTRRPVTTTKPTPSTQRPEYKPNSGHYKLVCYFTNWAWYRQGVAKYLPENIDTDLCTHIVYGFAVLDYSELTIRTHDSWADIDNKFYERVSGLKSRGVKVSLALGGWNDSQGDKYSRLVRSPASRAKFVRQAVGFIEKYGFEGLDLDWEYPVCWQTECNKGFADEKEGFSNLVKELSVAFRPKGLLLSTAVSPSKVIIDKGYDVPTLSEYFDWIAVMTYDYHGQWDKKTGHVAPLYQHPDDEITYFNANFSLHYWMEQGAPARKLVMGMPLYGQAFTLSDAKNHGLNARAPGPGTAGEFTRAAGFLAYYEICDRVKNKGWEVIQDPQGRMGPYAYKGNQWVSFDDKDMIRKKSELVRALGLGGGMVWALDLDDFTDRCGDGKHPLLSEIQRVLSDPPGNNEPTVSTPIEEPVQPGQIEEDPIDEGEEEEEEKPADNGAPEHVEDEVDEESESVEVANENSQKPMILADEYKVVCYFTNWAWYRQNHGKYLPEDIDADLCTHIVYGFAVLDREKLTIKSHDSWADLENHFYERVVAYKKKGLKVTVAIGGWNDSAGDKYSRLVRSAANRARFIRNVVEFIEKWDFDGLDLDWEYPVCWQVECGKGNPDEKQHFADFVQELSEEFKPRGWLLSTAVSPSKMVIDAGYDVPRLSEYFDWISVMAYDYHGQWDKKTGHVAPMYHHPDDEVPHFNTNFTINYWIEKGADPKKLVLGMPMYGQSFSLAETKRNGLNAPSYGGGEAGEGTRARGFLSYYEICENIQQKKWTVVRDSRGRMGPYAYLRDQWVSFDDSYMIRHKSEFVKAMGLAGAMIWALDLDDFRNVCDCEEYPLLRTINRVLRGYPAGKKKCILESAPEEKPMLDVIPLQTTTKRPSKPSRRPTKPATTTSEPIDDEIEESSTTHRPSRPSRPSRPGRPSRRPPTSTTTTTTTRRPTEPEQFDDEDEFEEEQTSCLNRNFVQHESDCNAYYQCNNGQSILQHCPPGLNWNEDHCDWPINTDCVSRDENEIDDHDVSSATTTRRTTTTTLQTTTTRRPSRKPFKPINPPAEDKGGYKVVCYFTNWAWYRPNEGKYAPEDIDWNLCTHIVYGFAVLNRETFTIKTHDPWADIDNKFYEKVTALRAKGVRVTIAIGGWNDSLGDKYSKLVRDPNNRAKFIDDVIDFIEKYNFDGLDLDWEYPVCWQVDCSQGHADEKEAFAEFVKELAQEFRPRGWLLSAAVSPSKMVIDAGYDVPTLAEYFNWIAVMTYDYHGNWDRQTGHVAPLYYYPGDKWDYFNANFTINYWIEKGAPPSKLIMGFPMYGQSFTLADPSNRGLNAQTYGPGEAGKYSRAGGFLAYYEICDKVNNKGWSVVRDPEGRIGPYAYNKNQWVSYDDVAEARRKARFIKDMKLGGGMIWALDLDDFRGTCGCGKHPLLGAINQELRGFSGPKIGDCT